MISTSAVRLSSRFLPFFLILTGCSAPEGNLGQISDHTTSPSSTLSTLGNTPLTSNPNLPWGVPVNQGKKVEILISRQEYVVSWNPETHTPNWTAWNLNTQDLGETRRSKDFYSDSLLDSFLQKERNHGVGEKDYSGSCFDRGHQVPSADRTLSKEVNVTTFFMSNMVPQTAFLNRVIWEHLEEHEREMVKVDGLRLQIFAGTLYSAKARGVGTKHDILVPSFNYKIIVPLNENGKFDAHDNRIIAVKMPNVTSKGTDPMDDHKMACDDFKSEEISPDYGSPNDWMEYKTTVEEIEILSGFRFLPN